MKSFLTSFVPFLLVSCLLCFVVSHQSVAAQLAFFQSFNAKGEPVIFEGLYSHAAVSFQGQWLHAHPYFGIELTSDLKKFGPHYKIIENPDYPEPTLEFVGQQLKKKFNIFADWNNPEETYCSKLVGKALNMTPTKMRFQSKNWRQTRAANYRGQLGLSPSDVYWYARRQLHFKSVKEVPPAFLQTPKTCNSFLSL